MIDNFFKEEKMIETPLELIESTIRKVEEYLKEISSDYISFNNGSFAITYGSSQIMIIVRPFTDKDSCVEVIANVVTGAEITNDLMRFLLRKNAELHFGAFGLLFDDTITFHHSITGTNLDKNELETSISAVAIISDYYDDEIVSVAGGKRATDISYEDFS